MTQLSSRWTIIFFTLMTAFVLTLLPMPEWAVWLRPAWVLLVIIYWVLAVPQQVNVGIAWLMGLLLDIINGTLMGEHAFAMTVVAYLVARTHLRLRMFPLVQQGLSVLFLVWIYQFILYCIQGFIGELPVSQLYWLSGLTSMVLWPWLFNTIQRLQYRSA